MAYAKEKQITPERIIEKLLHLDLTLGVVISQDVALFVAIQRSTILPPQKLRSQNPSCILKFLSSHSTRCLVRGVLFRFCVPPLLLICAILYLLHPFGHVHMKSFAFIVQIPKYYLAIRPVEVFVDSVL